MSVDLRDTIIDEQTKEFRARVGQTEDYAFLAFVNYLYFRHDNYDVPSDALIEGTGEKQIDLIHVYFEQGDETARICLSQVKNHRGFSSNTLLLMASALEWIFVKPLTQVAKLKNVVLRSRIKEIRDIRLEIASANIDVELSYITRGDTSKLSNEYIEERQGIIEKWGQAGFNSFGLQEIGAKEIVDQLNTVELRQRAVSADISFVYDLNRASLFEASFGNIKSVRCTIQGAELARVVSSGPHNAIFEKNVRRFKGASSGINESIYRACTDPGTASHFWCMNNGITMICDRLDVIKDPDNPIVRVQNVQIVNGCQTSMTIRKAAEEGRLQGGVQIQVRVYETSDQEFVDRIVLATNNQNSIRSRDLYANHEDQKLIQRVMKEQYGYYYERKDSEYRTDKAVPKRKIINNEKAGQAFLALVRKQPTPARAQKYRIFEDRIYNSVFHKVNVGQMVLSYFIVELCNKMGKEQTKTLDRAELEYAAWRNGSFHIGRVAASLLFGEKEWPVSKQALKKEISAFEAAEPRAKRLVANAFRVIRSILKKEAASYSSVINYFKSAEVQKRTNQKLGVK